MEKENGHNHRSQYHSEKDIRYNHKLSDYMIYYHEISAQKANLPFYAMGGQQHSLRIKG
jgi:hypothetical protein